MATVANKLVAKDYLRRQFGLYNKNVVAPQFVELNEDADDKVVKAEGYTLSKNDFDDAAKEKLTALENYVDTTVRAGIAANAAAIATLNGTVDQDGSVAKMVNTRVLEMVAGDDVEYDTLGKVDKWIAGHKTSAKDMEDAIKANADDIKALQDQQEAASYTFEDEDLDFSDINA